MAREQEPTGQKAKVAAALLRRRIILDDPIHGEAQLMGLLLAPEEESLVSGRNTLISDDLRMRLRRSQMVCDGLCGAMSQISCP
jgi:hypothetical protein